MAKKARRKLEEKAEERAFEFPPFDEQKFISHEFEQTLAMGVALAGAVGLGVLSWALQVVGTPWFVPVVLALAVLVAFPIVWRRTRGPAREYTKGDWATLLLTQLFGWLGFWFLFANVFPVAH